MPLVAPTSTDDRIGELAACACSFLYCVSMTGVTGTRAVDQTGEDLPSFLGRVRAKTGLPIAVGFGISTPEQVASTAKLGDGVVVGSALLKAVDDAGPDASTADRAGRCAFTASLKAGAARPDGADAAAELSRAPASPSTRPDEYGFGEFGGRYIPETLSEAHDELERAWNEAMADPAYHAELARYRKDFVGGPTPLYFASRLTEACGGAKIWLKREDLAHTGAHKINNAIGQVLLMKRLGKSRVIAETGAGQHGVATSTGAR